MPAPLVPMTAVEPILMFRASCHCGWWRILDTEDEAKAAVIHHTLNTRCDGCTAEIEHDAGQIGYPTVGVGWYCQECAPVYALWEEPAS